jgi:hypothetical protein
MAASRVDSDQGRKALLFLNNKTDPYFSHNIDFEKYVLRRDYYSIILHFHVHRYWFYNFLRGAAVVVGGDREISGFFLGVSL